MRKNKIGTILTIASYSLVGIHLINRYVSIHADYRDILPLSQNRFYSWKLGRVYYNVKGKGEPILLLHDITSGGSGYEWTRIEEELSQTHKVYTIDFPGCGRSEKVNQIYTNFVFVQFLVSFIRDIIKEETIVMASGYSCSVVIMANVYKENLFKKIILINPDNIQNLKKPVQVKGKIYHKIISTPILGTFIYHMHVSREKNTTLFINQYFSNPFKVDRDLMDAYYEAAHKGAYDCKFLYASKAAGYMNVDIQKALQSLSEETLLIRGEKEPGASTIDASYITLAPSIHRIVIKDTKHLPHLERPKKLLATIQAFLQME